MAGIPVQDELTPMGNYYLIRAKNVDVEGIRLDKVINQVKSSIEAIKTDFYTKEQSDAKYASKTDLNAKEDDIKHFKTWAEYEAAKATIPAGAMFVVDEDNPENQIPKHNLLEGRDEANAHPYTAIEGLQAQLDKKTDVSKTQTLESRMNQFAKLPEGSTAGDAELADIRVGADGKTYENAGEAVRGQVTSLKETIATLEQKGYPIVSIQQAVNDWGSEHLDEFVPDGSIDYNKFSEDVLKRIEYGYVTPQMFGAVGDGETDDYNAFVAAMDSGKPIIIPHGSYYISEQIVFSGSGKSIYMCGSASGVYTHLYCAKGIKIAQDNVTLKNFWLHGNDKAETKENNGITFSGLSNGAIISDVTLSHYSCCISNVENDVKGYTFGNKFERVRVYASESFLNFRDYGVGYNCYNNSFKDCWMLSTNKLGYFAHCRITFENCILFVSSLAYSIIAENAEIEFNSCSFETAKLESASSSYIFYNESYRLVFRNCNFTENASSNVFWFVNVKKGRIHLSECTFNAYSVQARSGGLLNMTYSSTCHTGSIEIEKLLMYSDSITEMIGKGMLERGKYNFLDGVGIQIQGGETDLKRGVVYTKTDQYAVFLGQYLYDGTSLKPLSPNTSN